VERSVARPQVGSAQPAGGEEENIGPTQPASPEPVLLHQVQRFFGARLRQPRKTLQIVENSIPFPKSSTRQLSDHRGMMDHAPIDQQFAEVRMAPPEMVDPYRRIHQHLHRADLAVLAVRRRGPALALRSVPPKAAKRWAAPR
jgi:hypothetical protein